MIVIGKTKWCIECGCTATHWDGFLIKSRDGIAAGFCPTHSEEKCPNTFGKKGCYGIYNKGLGELKAMPDDLTITIDN